MHLDRNYVWRQVAGRLFILWSSSLHVATVYGRGASQVNSEFFLLLMQAETFLPLRSRRRIAFLIATVFAIGTATFGRQNSAPALAPTPAPAAAPNSQIVANTTGIIQSEEGAAIPGAAVRLTNTDTNQAWVTWTDEAGKFQFPGLPAGNYRVEASQIGFVNASRVGVMPIFPSGPIPIVLHVATLAQLEAPQDATPPARGNPD